MRPHATLGDTPQGGAHSPIATPWVHVTPPPYGCSRICSGDRGSHLEVGRRASFNVELSSALSRSTLAPYVCLFCDATVSAGGYAGQRPINASNAKHINPTSTPDQTRVVRQIAHLFIDNASLGSQQL
ncbi:hypothetical protein PISMIDRAFT_685532, partial [Pisolithus microcarpus 441]